MNSIRLTNERGAELVFRFDNISNISLGKLLYRIEFKNNDVAYLDIDEWTITPFDTEILKKPVRIKCTGRQVEIQKEII